MALSFTGDSTDNVDHGSGATLDTIAQGTLIIWIRPTDVANSSRDIVSKEGSAGARGWEYFRRGADGSSVRFLWYGAAGGTVIDIISNTAHLATDTWCFTAATWNHSVLNGGKIYKGRFNSLAADDTASAAGSGTPSTAADSVSFRTGASVGGGTALPSSIAFLGVWGRILTLGEIQQQQFHQWPTSSCVLFTHYGLTGTGTQPDWSGNGNTGTVTGATVSSHVPLGPLFSVANDDAYIIAAAAARYAHRQILLGVG